MSRFCPNLFSSVDRAGTQSNESLFSGLGHQTLAAYAEVLTAISSSAAQDEGSAPPTVAHSTPNGVAETSEALICAG